MCLFVPAKLNLLVNNLVHAMESGDSAEFQSRLGALAKEAQRRGPAYRTAVISQLAPMLPDLRGEFSKVAVLVGACVEWGGSPLPLQDVLPLRVTAAMENYARFSALWTRVSGGQPLPDRENLLLRQSVLAALAESGVVSEQEAIRITVSYMDIDDWLQAAITVMAHRDFRMVMTNREEVQRAAAAIADDLQRASWVYGLSLVLDDEALVVLDQASGRGFELTMSGIGDNFQLHTLLAARLIGDPQRGLLDGDPPERAWVAAATDGPPRQPATAPIIRRFRLFDGNGNYVHPEGHPADITPFNGTRVLVLHPPLGRFGWTGGRTYQHMTPTLTLDRVMGSQEASEWLSRVTPAHQTDLMAKNRPKD